MKCPVCEADINVLTFVERGEMYFSARYIEGRNAWIIDYGNSTQDVEETQVICPKCTTEFQVDFLDANEFYVDDPRVEACIPD